MSSEQKMNPYTVRITQSADWEWGRGKYLEGPRDAKTVKTHGYGFTDDDNRSWPFPTWAKANAKAKIVAKHMSMSRDDFLVARRF